MQDLSSEAIQTTDAEIHRRQKSGKWECRVVLKQIGLEGWPRALSSCLIEGRGPWISERRGSHCTKSVGRHSVEKWLAKVGRSTHREEKSGWRWERHSEGGPTEEAKSNVWPE